LKSFLKKHKIPASHYVSKQALLDLKKSKLVPAYLQSLELYYNEDGQIDENFATLKREELLLILLQLHPEYSSILFDFGKPGKIDLEAFMTNNFKFNVSAKCFAFLTDRSLSAFKRDFMTVFNETPNCWLVQKRLEEAHFLIENNNQKPSDIYLDLGFENFSHFHLLSKNALV
jgi:AraC-like DNA-binding protein